jgi:hypothetical protein
VAITSVAYIFQPPRNVGTHTWETGVSTGVNGPRVMAQSFSLVSYMAKYLIAVREQLVQFAETCFKSFSFMNSVCIATSSLLVSWRNSVPRVVGPTTTGIRKENGNFRLRNGNIRAQWGHEVWSLPAGGKGK